MTPKVNIGPDLVEEHLHLISMDATTSVTYLLQQPPSSSITEGDVKWLVIQHSLREMGKLQTLFSLRDLAGAQNKSGTAVTSSPLNEARSSPMT